MGVYVLLTLLGMAGSAPAYAQPSESEASAEDTSVEDADEGFGATAVVPDRPDGPEDSLGRSIVNRRQMDERLPQSAPDALRYEPGVSIQQTAHGQASPYVRGLTGQQVVHLFDGVRLNNGIYRQGPNQYFFTVDSQTLQRLEVIRGSASTRFGSDALGGAILAVPREPALSEDGALSLRPRAFGSFASADTTVGGRAELSAAFGENTAVLAGGGYRRVGRLEGGGVLRGTDGLPALVARLDDDRRTQLGTGFKEATFDFRLRQRIAEELTINVATYTYLELDSPRTDQCPPPEAPESECLVIDRQLRSLAYAALRGNAGKELRDVELIVSYQRHEEARTRDRSRSFVRLDFENEVDTLGITFRAATPRVSLGEGAHLTVRYGAEAYRDSVSSEGSTTFTDLDRTFENSRGEYLDDSTYLSVGAFAEAEFQPFEALIVRGGGRLAAVGARAPSDPESGSSAVHKEWGAAIGRLGVEVRP
ncbi:MAG: TonB-dependent receptor plug domain-containing protein, partial [Myxococcota bacterium]